ncbi:sulfite oxidase [Aurantivibrio plasticivorans]
MSKQPFDNKANESDTQRRQFLKRGLATGALASLPSWALPALAAGEELIPFSDMPKDFARGEAQPGAMHFQDTRKISRFYSRNEDFYVVQHYGQPDLDPNTHQLSISGLVDKPLNLSIDDLKQYKQVEMDIGFECGGNQQRLFHGLIGNARWKGVRLKDVLKDSKLQQSAREIVFFGADAGEETVRDNKVMQHFGRSLSVEEAMESNALLALEMNGEPLPLFHGKPVRLIVPGWYGVANVKWLERIHVQDTRYMGRFMAKDYVTLKKDPLNPDTWVQSSVSRMHMKSVIVRATQNSGSFVFTGFVVNDGSKLDRVEVKLDNGEWQTAKWHKENSRYSWKLFSFETNKLPPGEHTIVSRVIDRAGNIQPTLEEAPEKATYWENFAQQPRTFTV